MSIEDILNKQQTKEATPRTVATLYCLYHIGFNVFPGEDAEIKEHVGYIIPLYTSFYVIDSNLINFRYKKFQVGEMYLNTNLQVVKVTPNKEIDETIKKHKIELFEKLISDLKKEVKNLRGKNLIQGELNDRKR